MSKTSNLNQNAFQIQQLHILFQATMLNAKIQEMLSDMAVKARIKISSEE